MGFFKGLGTFIGTVAGEVVGGAVNIVGEVTDSDFIREIGDGVKVASKRAGETLGQAAEGAAGVVEGIVTSDSSKINEGLGNVVDAVGTTAVGIGKGVGNIASNGMNVIEGISEGDYAKVNHGVKNLAKTAAIGALAIGVADMLDIVGDDSVDVAYAEYGDAEGYVNVTAGETSVASVGEETYVSPHYVQGYERADGTHVDGYWRDGDGNPNTILTRENGGGYTRSI